MISIRVLTRCLSPTLRDHFGSIALFQRLLFCIAILLACSLVGCQPETVVPIPTVPAVDTYPEVLAAIETARDWVRKHPESAPAWGRLGMHFAAHEFTAEAEQCYQQATDLDPTAARWPYLLGVLVETSDPIRSAAYLQQANERSPGELYPRLRCAELMLSQGKIQEARPVLETLQQEFPQEARVRYRLAQVHLLQNQTELALEQNTQAVKQLPLQRSVRELQAQLLFATGQTEVAARELAVLHELLDLQTGWPDPWLEEVRACRHDPHWRLTEAHWLSTSGNLTEAENRLRELVTKYPDEWLFAAQYARCQLALKKSADVVDTVSNALRHHPEVADLYRLRGSAHLLRQEWTHAESDYARAVKLKPDDVAAWSDRAFVQEQMENAPAAIESLRQALRLEPRRQPDRVRLIQLLQKQEQWDAARTELQALLAREPRHPERMSLEQRFPQ